MFQMFFVPGLYREAAAQAYSVTGEIIPADYPGAFFMALRQPAGVVGAFGPFNVPYILSSRAFALPLGLWKHGCAQTVRRGACLRRALIGRDF